MHVRDAVEQDAEGACLVIRRSIVELCGLDHQGDAATLQRWLANKTPDNIRAWTARHHVLVAVEGDAILGVAAMTGAGELLLNYVSPDARFRGVGKALIQTIEARAVRLGLSRIALKSTATAVRFYHAAGYTQSGQPTRGFGVTMAHPMHKQLPPLVSSKPTDPEG